MPLCLHGRHGVCPGVVFVRSDELSLRDVPATDTVSPRQRDLGTAGTERDDMATATTEPVRLPPGTADSEADPGHQFLVSNHGMFAALTRRYDSDVVQRESAAHQPCGGDQRSSPGQGTVQHRAPIWSNARRRGPAAWATHSARGRRSALPATNSSSAARLWLPPFHGKRMRSYEPIIEEEVMREIATWPEGREFETLQPMMRITLGAILRAVFGAEGPALDELRESGAAHGHARSACSWCCPPIMRRTWVRGVRGGGICGTGAVSTLSSTSLIAEARADPASGRAQAMCWRCCCRPATKTASRSRIGTSPTSC